MKKTLVLVLLLLSSFISRAICPMGDGITTACIKYDASTGKTVVKLTHPHHVGYPMWDPNCAFLRYYQPPLTTWLYVKDPSGPGFFGPFKITATIPHDPTIGEAYSYYEVSIPGFSTQQCYEVYAVSNIEWQYYDPANAWGYTPPAGLDPRLPETVNRYLAPNGMNFGVHSTQAPMLACLCEGSDTLAACNSNFKFNLTSLTAVPPGSFLVKLSGVVDLIEFHPLSSYFIDWGSGNVPYSGMTSLMPYISPSGSYTVCITEVTSNGDSCKTCMDFCIPTSYSVAIGGGSGGSMMKKAATTKDPSEGLNIEMYPNPTSGLSELKFSLFQKERVEVRVTDISGKQLFQIPSKEWGVGTHKLELNTGNLPTGLYQVHIKMGNEMVTKKLAIVK